MSRPPVLEGCDVLPPMDEPTNCGRRRPSNSNEAAPRLNGETGERFKVLNRFVDFTLKDLTRSETTVWLVLYRDTREGEARASQADIARRAGLDPRSVRRAMSKLERRNLLTVVRRGGLNQGPSTYRVRATGPDP